MPEMAVLLLGSSALFVVGLCDDLKRLRIRTKLLAQCGGAILVCLAGVRIEEIVVRDLFTLELGNFGIIVTILWIIGITNAVNLIDGLDGLAAGISGIASAVIAVLALWQGNAVLAVVMLALCGSLTGFLFFNFHPAKIFMGDSGSLFLGFILAVSSVMTAAKSEALVGTCLPIIVLGIPIFDTFFSVLRRYLDRRGIMSPDRGHFHHVLLKRGLKQHHVAMLAYAITALVSGLGFVMIWTRSTLTQECRSMERFQQRDVSSVKLRRHWWCSISSTSLNQELRRCLSRLGITVSSTSFEKSLARMVLFTWTAPLRR